MTEAVLFCQLLVRRNFTFPKKLQQYYGHHMV